MLRDKLKNFSILFVEDEPEVRESLYALLKIWTPNVYTAADGEEGLTLYREMSPDIIITDIRMPVMDGLEMIDTIRKENSELPIIVTTAFDDKEYLLQSIKQQVNGYLLKPVEKKELKRLLETIAKLLLFDREQRILQTMIDTDDTIIVAFSQNEILYTNHTFFDYFQLPGTGNDEAEDEKKKFDAFCTLFLNQDEQEMLAQHSCGEVIVPLLEKESHSRVLRIREVHSGALRTFSINLSTVHEKSDIHLLRLIDITDLEAEKNSYKTIAQEDRLTGVFNRAKFDEFVEHEIAKFKRYGEEVSLIICDIDHFKQVNDTYGHITGDNVLKSVANVMKEHIRETDILARWGGEEFVILLPNTPLQSAISVAEKIRCDIELTTFETVGRITLSCGVSEIKSGDSEESWFKRSDHALYEAKKAGRNRVVHIDNDP